MQRVNATTTLQETRKKIVIGSEHGKASRQKLIPKNLWNVFGNYRWHLHKNIVKRARRERQTDLRVKHILISVYSSAYSN